MQLRGKSKTTPSLVLCSGRVLVTIGSMRRSLQPNQVAQVVQLFQDGTSMRTAARGFAVYPSTVSIETEKGRDTDEKSGGVGYKRGRK